uniref:Uncharacterized protein n=1 Tax=Lactuca sativa TaxID=4236 RepID=A0A9R1VQ92_LACSA|nr:hypothetical protein LSAT_V11C400178080 [Lactuca sativa]
MTSLTSFIGPEKKNESKKKRKDEDPTKKRKKKTVNKHFDTIKNRCSPGALLSIIQGFNTIKKDCVKQMGFGDLLKMKMTEVLEALSCYVVDKFDPKKMKIPLREGVEIDVTRESFSKLPFGKENNKCYDEWTKQFENKKMIRLHEIKMNIVALDNADMNFQRNFIALLINSLIESSSCGKANTYPLNYIMKNTNIRDIDWCSYFLNCLVKT